MPIAKNITEVIGDSARYLLILFIGFLFIKIYFPQAERYIDLNLFLIIVILLLIIAILLEKKFIPERYKEYAEDEAEMANEGNVKDTLDVDDSGKISLTKKEILYVAAISILGMVLIYYALFLNYKLLPVYLLLLLSVTAGLLIAFLSYETMKEDKKKMNNGMKRNLNQEIQEI